MIKLLKYPVGTLESALAYDRSLRRAELLAYASAGSAAHKLLLAYSGADYTTDLYKKCSMSRGVVTLGGGAAISWAL